MQHEQQAQQRITSNIAFGWFMEFGMQPGHDAVTIRNILDDGFIAHAKKGAFDAYEETVIDNCVAFQREQLAAIAKAKGGAA